MSECSAQTPGGEDIPQNVMIWGLPHKTSLDDENTPYTGAVQDVEIRHIPAPASSDTSPAPAPSANEDNDTSGELTTLEEVDYLAPLFGSSEQARPRDGNNYGVGWSQPVATRIILSREQFEQMKLNKLNEVEDQVTKVQEQEDDLKERVDTLYDRQKAETEFYKNLFKSLMTTAEQKKVFGNE